MTASMARQQPRPNTPPIYLDYQSTTPVDRRVLAEMLPWFTEKFGNPHSVTHAYGREAEAAVEEARAQVAALIGAEPREIIFTSGATESNNLAIKGAARFHRAQGRDHVVTVATEHKCVLESARAMAREGCRVTVLPVDAKGFVDLARLAAAIDERTAIVSVMAANNEIGVLQPVAEIGALCRARGALFHSDAAQAVGKVPVDVEAMQIDLMSISGHKVYGPKGIGALYVRRRPRARIEPLVDGGAQERGLRSGTLPTPLCIGLGAAARLAREEMADEAARLLALRWRFLSGLKTRLPEVQLNGDAERRLPGNLNLSFPGVPALALMEACPGLALSTGSACTAAAVEPSYVLRALGLEEALAGAALRIGLGRYTTEAEVDFAVDALAAAARRLARGDRVTGGGGAPT
ncbi:MAG TPA: aminotransferase class V-fold PLP-dependent enzyme [Stellaceae bacterium]|nr:aminotransferase class V-fold PLP-dependent enzyme [Stellaceae bacterium]